ncbi:MAG TPA: hypothetical protein VI759_10575 [Dehalococcoidia bacterium]|nr:hypothetical protein [Dehalococcoidia bacterium]
MTRRSADGTLVHSNGRVERHGESEELIVLRIARDGLRSDPPVVRFLARSGREPVASLLPPV